MQANLKETTKENSATIMPSQGWLKFNISTPDRELLDRFNDLAQDEYAPHCQRYRRFSQYKATATDGVWNFEKLPHRPFIQSAKFNSHSGGVLRNFEPLECDIQKPISEILDAVQANYDQAFQLDVHQYRVYASPNAQGISVPEGMHQDGHELVAIMVYKRHLISGSEFTLHKLDTKETFLKTIVGENEAVVIEDEKMYHNASNVTPTSTEVGYRDYIVVNINRWENRRYGPDFEREAGIKLAP